MTASGPVRLCRLRRATVRSSLHCGHITARRELRLRAKKRLSHCSKMNLYSITSSARVAIDAPPAPPAVGSRLSDAKLGRVGLSSFRTPAAPLWEGIREECARHLRAGGGAASLPHANKINLFPLHRGRRPYMTEFDLCRRIEILAGCNRYYGVTSIEDVGCRVSK